MLTATDKIKKKKKTEKIGTNRYEQSQMDRNGQKQTETDKN